MNSSSSESMAKGPITNDPAGQKALKLVFVTLFLDLMSFSIVFPLFPAMARYYLQHDQGNFFLELIFKLIHLWVEKGQDPTILFGSILTLIFSFLQFLATPIWGRLSDRIGRRPVLLMTILGLGLSHILWIFAGSFSILLLGRVIGGIMSGNLSTATAVIADVTDKNNRTRGMAIVGMAFALGFILGPLLGGVLSKIHLEEIYPQWVNLGINPFSMPAIMAVLLSMVNLFLVKFKFDETFQKRDTKEGSLQRSVNPFVLFKRLPYKGTNLCNFAHFFFITIFSGVEFALIFMLVDKFHFTPMNNGLMFLYLGICLALIQGGYVRRKAHLIKNKTLLILGLTSLAFSLLIIGFAPSVLILFIGLFFFALGSSFSIPGLSSAVSCYSPAENQGQVIGVFRSLGSLGRVLGPPIFSIIYWKFGMLAPFMMAVLCLLAPFLMVLKLP